MDIGNNIKKIRKLNNLTQEQLAEEIYYSCQSISNWERNISVPPLQIILYISRKYNFPIDEFFVTKDFKEETKNEIYKLSIWLLKNHKTLSIDNIIMHSSIDSCKITDFMANDKQLISFVIEEFEKNIENKILKEVPKYDSYYDFILDYIIYLIYDNKEIVSLFYKYDYISKIWKKYLVEKYNKLMIEKFSTPNDDYSVILIKIIVDLFQNWLTDNPIMSVDNFKLKLIKIFNTKVRYL